MATPLYGIRFILKTKIINSTNQNCDYAALDDFDEHQRRRWVSEWKCAIVSEKIQWKQRCRVEVRLADKSMDVFLIVFPRLLKVIKIIRSLHLSQYSKASQTGGKCDENLFIRRYELCLQRFPL